MVRNKLADREMTLLEKEIEKSVKVRGQIADILAQNYPIEKEYADIIALDAANQAVGEDKITKYYKDKEAKEFKARYLQARRELIQSIKDKAWYTVSKIIPSTIGASLLVLIVFSIGSCLFSVATAPTYPRTYKPLPETIRFENARSTSYRNEELSKKVPLVMENELNDYNHLCIKSDKGISKNHDYDALVPICVNPNKVGSLNAALDKAVKEDINGVVWNEPNGNGEVWTVERNNWRFIITATEDSNYK
jgi:hypothetical protein